MGTPSVLKGTRRVLTDARYARVLDGGRSYAVKSEAETVSKASALPACAPRPSADDDCRLDFLTRHAPTPLYAAVACVCAALRGAPPLAIGCAGGSSVRTRVRCVCARACVCE
jgi:hypothetical protein